MKLKRFYITENELDNKHITSAEAFHAITVLRLKEGNKISLFCNDEYDYIAEITYVTKFGINFEILEKIKNISNPNVRIKLYQALAKNDKLELIIQKATEIGITDFQPFHSTNCDVKKNTAKVDRLEKIMIGACKQSGRSKLVQLFTVEDLKNLYNNISRHDIVFFANETETRETITEILTNNTLHDNIGIIVGPEGGFSNEEIDKLKSIKNLKSVTLGSRILRTETAGLYMISVISDILRV